MFRVLTQPDKLVSSSALLRLGEPGVTVEKLADPEPEWVNGDVIRLCGSVALTYVRVGDKWIIASSGEQADSDSISNVWRVGRGVILYKADAAPLPREAVYDADFLS